MKKFALLLCIAVLLSFAGFAFAQDEPGGHGGHVDPHARVYLEAAIDYNPSSSDVVVPSGQATLVGVAPVGNASDDFTADIINLPGDTINRVYVQTTLSINIENYGTTSADHVDITLKNYPTYGAKSHLYAFIKAKSGTQKYRPNEYHAFEANLTSPDLVSSDLTFTVDAPADFFTSNDVIIAETRTSSGGGDSGCNAGFAGLLLFAAVPLIYFRKKK
ncbi:MAG: SYNERG-CTERM sorting domain-containing protein [Synergistaceae bacterium]|nr:SYNERG-CTERM sorting domain-containing protein [Synergistaceae bacterium]